MSSNLSPLIYKIEESNQQSFLNFIAQIASLAGTIFAIFRIVFKNFEGIVYPKLVKLSKKLKKKKKIDLTDEIEPNLTEMDSIHIENESKMDLKSYQREEEEEEEEKSDEDLTDEMNKLKEENEENRKSIKILLNEVNELKLKIENTESKKIEEIKEWIKLFIYKNSNSQKLLLITFVSIFSFFDKIIPEIWFKPNPPEVSQ